MTISLFVFIAIAVLIVSIGLLYNALVSKSQMVNNAWADIDVQLKRRSNLIPQIVSTVKAYAAHEKELFEDIVSKRNEALAAGDNTAARGTAESALSPPVSRLIAIAEDYPDLKANENFLDLQNELSDTENKIEMARRFYNGAVRELNIAVRSFPANLLSGAFGFRSANFFEIDLADRKPPEVNL